MSIQRGHIHRRNIPTLGTEEIKGQTVIVLRNTYYRKLCMNNLIITVFGTSNGQTENKCLNISMFSRKSNSLNRF